MSTFLWAATGKARPAAIANLILTFLASGLWHGANWTYLVWGGLHGGIQAIENHLLWRKKITRLSTRIFGIAGTFTVFVVTFTIFPRRQHRCGGRVFPLPCDDARL